MYDLKKIFKGIIRTTFIVISMGAEIALISKFIRMILNIKFNTSLYCATDLLTDCIIIGFAAYALTVDIKKVWEDS